MVKTPHLQGRGGMGSIHSQGVKIPSCLVAKKAKYEGEKKSNTVTNEIKT